MSECCQSGACNGPVLLPSAWRCPGPRSVGAPGRVGLAGCICVLLWVLRHICVGPWWRWGSPDIVGIPGRLVWYSGRACRWNPWCRRSGRCCNCIQGCSVVTRGGGICWLSPRRLSESPVQPLGWRSICARCWRRAPWASKDRHRKRTAPSRRFLWRRRAFRRRRRLWLPFWFRWALDRGSRARRAAHTADLPRQDVAQELQLFLLMACAQRSK